MTVATTRRRPKVTAPPAADPEALIEEARFRQRRRRRRQALAVLLLVGAGIAAYVGFDRAGGSHSSSSASVEDAALARLTVRVHLVGFGSPLPAPIGSGPCPQGRTVIAIESDAGARIGTARVCVLTIRKLDRPNWGVRRIVQTVREVDSLPGGKIVSRQTQTFLFARDQRHTTATFRGRVVRGSGRYAGVRGSVSGGGGGVDGKAKWRVTFRLLGA